MCVFYVEMCIYSYSRRAARIWKCCHAMLRMNGVRKSTWRDIGTRPAKSNLDQRATDLVVLSNRYLLIARCRMYTKWTITKCLYRILFWCVGGVVFIFIYIILLNTLNLGILMVGCLTYKIGVRLSITNICSLLKCITYKYVCVSVNFLTYKFQIYFTSIFAQMSWMKSVSGLKHIYIYIIV